MARQASFDLPRFFQALGDNTRLRLLNLMGEQEVCVCYLVKYSAAPAEDLPASRLPAQRWHRLSPARGQVDALPHRHAAAHRSTQILRQTLECLKEDKAMQADRARLTKACCSPAKYALDGAPPPLPASPHHLDRPSTDLVPTARDVHKSNIPVTRLPYFA